MSIDASIFIWVLVIAALLLLFRAVWTVVVLVLGLLVAGLIILFIADLFAGGTAMSQVIDLLVSQLVPLVGATTGTGVLWFKQVKPTQIQTKYD